MAVDSMNDGMGKKIVEALKMQTMEHSDGEVFVNEDASSDSSSTNDFQPDNQNASYNNSLESSVDESFVQTVSETLKPSVHSELQKKVQSQLQEQAQQMQFQSAIQSSSFVDNAFQQTLVNNLGVDSFAQDDFSYPPNIAVLKQLIAKLPNGVSRQTGAIIIKQTMEALGISMSSVLQEAKQFQDSLNANSVECQNNVAEYRKQIALLEAKSQQYQRQSAVMSDIINLFVQTSVR